MQKLTQELLKELLSYDPNTGVFTWLPRDAKWFKSLNSYLSWNTKHANTIAGSPNNKGYIKILIFGKSYAAHRLAWLYAYSEWPKKQVDHINAIKHDNSISNLREASNSENLQNRSSCLSSNKATGMLGVSFHNGTKKYQASIRLNRKHYYLGLFITPEEAHAAYVSAKRKLHPFSTL
jgi:hypothetical protein